MQKYVPNECLVHIFEFYGFPLKSTTSRNVLGVITRTTFLLHACESSFQNVAVASDFLQNSAPHARMLLQLPIKQM